MGPSSPGLTKLIIVWYSVKLFCRGVPGVFGQEDGGCCDFLYTGAIGIFGSAIETGNRQHVADKGAEVTDP